MINEEKSILYNKTINDNIFKINKHFLSKQIVFKEFLNGYIILMKMPSVYKEMKEGHVKKSFVNRKRRNNKAIVFFFFYMMCQFSKSLFSSKTKKIIYNIENVNF